MLLACPADCGGDLWPMGDDKPNNLYCEVCGKVYVLTLAGVLDGVWASLPAAGGEGE